MTGIAVKTWDNRSGPEGATNTIQGLTTSTDSTREGLAMNATRTCSIQDCDKQAATRGWCKMHYTRWQRHGDPLRLKFNLKDQSARFWLKVDRRANNECWPWLGTVLKNGYGAHSIGSRRTSAHRFAYEFAIGPIPNGLTIDHVKTRGCTRTDCVNPAHLEAVTLAENLRRSANAPALNARKTACPVGHEYSVKPNGERFCRLCENENQRRRRAKLRGTKG